MRVYQMVAAATLVISSVFLVVAPAYAAKAYRTAGTANGESVTTATGRHATRCHYTYHGTNFTTIVAVSPSSFQRCPETIDVN